MPVGRKALLVVVAAFAVAPGCSCGDTRIIGECRASTEAVRVVEPPPGRSVSWPGVGRIGSFTLVSWHEIIPVGTATVQWIADVRAQWFDEDLRPVGPVMPLGRTFQGFRVQWVEREGALEGQVWADPLERDPLLVPEEETLHVWSLAPPPDGRAQGTRIPFDAADDLLSIFDTAPQLPSAVAHGSRFSAFVAQVCAFGYDQPRLVVLRDSDAPSVVSWAQEYCRDPRTFPDVVDLDVYAPWLIALRDGGLGVIVGRATRPASLHYFRIDAAGRPDSEPRLVGRSRLQARAVATPGGEVLFTESGGNRYPSGGGLYCKRLRVMRDDGSDPHDAPWQLACTRPDQPPVTNNAELAAIPGAAVLVWGERTGPNSGFGGVGDPFEEGVYAVILTPEGRRGSDILTVTDPEASTRVFGGGNYLAGEFGAVAASAGTELSVAWADRRPETPGIYARRLHCAADMPQPVFGGL